MAQERIFIVEDEGIVAADLENLLLELGYKVVGTASSGEEALDNVEAASPDLVLMDIRLKGPMDGIDAAEQIAARLNIPVTYLTAYADENTLGRAKATMPYGYILKPFEERNLRTTLELALYKHKMESMMATLDSWHGTALRSLADPVIAVNARGAVTFLNASAENHFGWSLRDAYGKPLEEIFHFTLPKSQTASRVAVQTKSGKVKNWVCGAAPIHEEGTQDTGSVLVLHSPD